MMRNHTKIITLKDGYHVWTRSVGKGPVTILLLHGGPGMDHEYLTPFTKFVKDKPIRVIYYDQLGSYFSDQPDDPSLWVIPRFVKELEEVRAAWHLDQFYLYGQSWGGMLAMEYAARPEDRKHLKGLIDSNMLYSEQAYLPYIKRFRAKVLSKADVKYMVRDEKLGKDRTDPKYARLCNRLYHHCICRLPKWPHDVQASFDHTNQQVYLTMQGPSEFNITGNYKDWNIKDRLHQINTPTLVIGGRHDSMDPAVQRETAQAFPHAKFHLCPKGSHFSLWDDQKDYFHAIYRFIHSVETNSF